MAITKKALRQEVICAFIPFSFADLAGLSGVFAPACEVPVSALVLSTRLVMLTAFNSATSDAFSVGDQTLPAAPTPVSFTASAAVPVGTPQVGAANGKVYTANAQVGITWTGVGAVPTAGNGLLIVEYVSRNRGQFAQGLG